MHSPAEIQLLCPGQSLWSLISEHAFESELLKVHEALGHHLVDMYTELHTEAEMYHKMWHERQWSGNHGSRAETPFPCPQGSPLADPPAVKELVRAEVKMLLQNFKEKACKGAGDDEELLFQYKPEAVHYALDHQEIHYSSLENTDQARRSSSSCSVESSAEDEIEAVRDKLNVTEIHKVVTQLRSVFLSECDALTTMIKHFKGILKQQYHYECEPKKSEPSLAELRELRAALQMDLKLLPSSSEASHPFPVKGLKNSFRLSPGQSSAPHILIPMPVLRPASPSLCNLKPKPPSSHPPTKPPRSKTRNQNRFTSAFNILSEPPPCSKMDSSERASSFFTNDPKISQSKNRFGFSTEQNLLGVHQRTCLNFHLNSERNSPSPESHLSSHGCIHTPSTDLSPRKERKASPAWSSRNINTTPLSAPALSHFCDAGSNHSVLTKGKVKAQNGQQNSNSGGNSEAAAVQMDTSERSLVISQTPAQHSKKKYESGLDEDKMSHLRVDTNKQQSPDSHSLTDDSSHPPKGSEVQRHNSFPQPPSVETIGKYVILPEKPQRNQNDQPKNVQNTQTQFQFPNMFYQPVHSARMQTSSH